MGDAVCFPFFVKQIGSVMLGVDHWATRRCAVFTQIWLGGHSHRFKLGRIRWAIFGRKGFLANEEEVNVSLAISGLRGNIGLLWVS